jgi:hypothetical protein
VVCRTHTVNPRSVIHLKNYLSNYFFEKRLLETPSVKNLQYYGSFGEKNNPVGAQRGLLINTESKSSLKDKDFQEDKPLVGDEVFKYTNKRI